MALVKAQVLDWVKLRLLLSAMWRKKMKPSFRRKLLE
jgi:hypothetical protein